jgi:hypothetical protein
MNYRSNLSPNPLKRRFDKTQVTNSTIQTRCGASYLVSITPGAARYKFSSNTIKGGKSDLWVQTIRQKETGNPIMNYESMHNENMDVHIFHAWCAY